MLPSKCVIFPPKDCFPLEFSWNHDIILNRFDRLPPWVESGQRHRRRGVPYLGYAIYSWDFSSAPDQVADSIKFKSLWKENLILQINLEVIDESPDLPSNEVKGWISPPLQGPNAFAVEIEDLINCIEKDKEPLDSGKDGRAALEVLLVIYESSRTHTRVTFPMEMKKSPLDAMVEAGVV